MQRKMRMQDTIQPNHKEILDGSISFNTLRLRLRHSRNQSIFNAARNMNVMKDTENKRRTPAQHNGYPSDLHVNKSLLFVSPLDLLGKANDTVVGTRHPGKVHSNLVN